MKLFRTSIEQTGVTIVEDNEGNLKQIPLYSNSPCKEARVFAGAFGCKIKDTFYTNSMMDYKIEDCVRDFEEKYGFLPENYMDEMVNGFPFIHGMVKNYCYYYK